MFELMYEHHGIGLAATQVDLPFQLFVINPSGQMDSIADELVFINPVLQLPKGNELAEEGCLSLPGVYGDVVRPAQIHVTAYNAKGEEFDQVVDGILARVIQHEFDHLQGVLFPDRMSEAARKSIADELYAFEIEFDGQRNTGEIPSDEVIAARLRELETKFC